MSSMNCANKDLAGGSRKANNAAVVALSIGGTLAFSAIFYYANRLRRSRWMSEEERAHGHETTHSVIDHFKSLILDPETTVEEANKRRTTSYYLKMRESHSQSLVLGVGPFAKLAKLREKEMDRSLHYWRRGNQSHRTIVVMCDQTTRRLLADARRRILEPLEHSHDITTRGVWIPLLNIIPEQDMHVTIALPWWWHTIRQGNDELTKKMAQRFKQTLLLEFHYPFEIELERIILLGGKVVVALWRCVGERTTEDGRVVHDRHGENIDPMVRLREEIIRCFITESPDQRRKPLTYQHRMNDGREDTLEPKSLERQHTIQGKTPGMGVSADGFIHTTLCRLPLECLSSHDVELDKVHRLCREASATLNGHRMVISSYRILETMGEGGESNPCFKPLYEETIDAPLQHTVDIDGNVTERRSSQAHHQQMTIGPARNFLGEISGHSSGDGEEMNENRNANALAELFQPPE